MESELEDAVEADAVIFTSGSKGVLSLLEDQDYLRRLHLSPGKQLIGAMCSGALLLAKLGLLQGKKATTYPTVQEILKGFGVDVVDESFVRKGNIATAAGCLAAIDLVEWIITSLV